MLDTAFSPRWDVETKGTLLNFENVNSHFNVDFEIWFEQNTEQFLQASLPQSISVSESIKGISGPHTNWVLSFGDPLF